MCDCTPYKTCDRHEREGNLLAAYINGNAEYNPELEETFKELKELSYELERNAHEPLP